MLYFKHNELVEKFRVSLKTVHNWIDAAKQGKLDLQLHVHNGRTYIANTASNNTVLETQAEKGKKYRNTLHHKIVTPDPEFYSLYSRRQILDIISNLEIHREIPRQYNYFDGGATNWEKYAERMSLEKGINPLKSTMELLRANFGAINLLVSGYKRVNLIDIGPGNARPIKELVAHLLKKEILHRYIAIDISESMLEIAERNIKSWFDDKVQFEGHVRDITYERFDDIIGDDMLASEAKETINLVLILGGTPVNFPNPYDLLKVVNSSMGPRDLLFYTVKPDSPAQRRDFQVNEDAGTTALSSKYSFILDLLNIDESLYDVEMGFNENEKGRWRYIQIKLKSALTLNFKFGNIDRSVSLEKGETILLWRAWSQTALEIISASEQTGFTFLQTSLTKNRQYLLTISGVETRLHS